MMEKKLRKAVEQEMIFKFYIPFICAILLAIKLKGKKIIYNENAWLTMWWLLILGVYFTCGVKWDYELSKETFAFIILCYVAYLIFRFLGMKIKKNRSSYSKILSLNNLKKYEFIGYLGIILFLIDFLRLNSLGSITKASYNISIIGSIGILLIPVLLVLGLYYLTYNLIAKQKISIKAIFMLILYTVPCIINSGRESILYILIGVCVVYAYYSDFKDKRIFTFKSLKTRILFVVGCSIGILTIINISFSRYTSTEVNTYLNTHYVPVNIQEEAKSLGHFEFLYYNILSYFDNQIPFLEFVFKEYKGPYMFGMYELNIVSRRLPKVLELDYRLVMQQLKKLFMINGVNFSGSWQTVLGSLIFDFGRIGTPIVCAIIGYIVGIGRRRFEQEKSINFFVLITLFCVSSISNVQLGPFYSTFVYGSFIWWFIVFNKKDYVEQNNPFNDLGGNKFEQ